jgi:hypothetical protein
MNFIVKKSLPHVIAMALFLALTSIYFAPGLFEGKVIQQDDLQKVSGMGEELNRYYKEEGGKSAWTNSMFSGMPSYHIHVHGNPPNYLNYLEKPILAIDYAGASMILVALICFYILMCIMRVKPWLAIAGSIAYAFASYNLIIIAVGHVTKMYAIAHMPLTLAGMILLFRKNELWGAILFTLGVTLSFMSFHIQVTYYLALFCIIFFIGLSINEFRKKAYSFWTKISAIILLSLVISVLPSLSGLYTNYEVGQESMRGPSELTVTKDDPGEKASSGLDIDYAFAWSYGRSELLTLLIPNIYGGTYVEPWSESKFCKTYKSMGGKIDKNFRLPTYWGDQPFTSGPVYFGAIVCFLFVLGMFIIKNPIKWWIAGASLLFIFLSLGKNLAGFNEFIFHHLPQYNKFRTPSMALVIPGLTFPLIGFWGLKQIVDAKVDIGYLKKSLLWSLSLVGGICLIMWIMPGLFFSFSSPSDAQYQMPDQLLDALIADRKSMASADAFRSLIFILLSGGLIFYFFSTRNKKAALPVLGIGMLVLVTIDLWVVDKRYLNDRSFSKQKLSDSYKETPADKFILQDKSPSYRVLNLAPDTFNETQTSYFHKSIGGYHAAKLGRYQELIDHRIVPEMNIIRSAFQTTTNWEDLLAVFKETPTLNMLNAKYIIYHPEQSPLVNAYANGNAWFVDQVEFVPDADREIEALNRINPQTTAVIDEKFAASVTKPTGGNKEENFIQLIDYKPNILKYEFNSSGEQIVVFSEIYYNHGWKAFVDGEPTDHFRANWILRAMNVPAGKHTLEFRFEPDTYNLLTSIGSISSLILLCGLIGAIVYSIFRTRNLSKTRL